MTVQEKAIAQGRYVAEYATESGASLAAARCAANGGPICRVEGPRGGGDPYWAVVAESLVEAHEAQQVLCRVTDHGRLDSRGTGWLHVESVREHLVCTHCGAGMHGEVTVPHRCLTWDARLVECGHRVEPCRCLPAHTLEQRHSVHVPPLPCQLPEVW